MIPQIIPQRNYIKGFWRFEETSGTTVKDYSDNSHDGTASRTQILVGTSGRIGACGIFDAASSDKITVDNHSDLNPSGAFSISLWVKTTQSGTYIGLIDKYTGATSGYMIDIPSSDGKPRFGCYKGANYAIQSNIAINDGFWHHVCATYDGSNIRIYVDSQSGSPTALTGSVTGDINPFYIGGDGVSTNYFTGCIDEVIFWNGIALSLDEVKKINCTGRYIVGGIAIGSPMIF